MPRPVARAMQTKVFVTVVCPVTGLVRVIIK